ncbi:MAG: OmpA family protein [Deltaproteobacteria bacterium]|nr:OmpA family protein [Deltaproteobacteria bacterium]
MRPCLLSALAVLASFAAQAAEEPARFPAERFRPALSRDGIVDVEPGAVPAHLDADVALWLGYAHEPLALYRKGDDGLERAGALVGPRVGANLVLSLGLFDWLQLGLDVPVVVYQARGALPDDVPIGGLVAGGLGDVRISPKFQLLRASEHVVDLALMPTITAPTSLPRGDYLGEKFFTFAPEVLVSRSLAGVRLAVDAGYRARSLSKFGGIVAGHEVFYRAGVAMPLENVGIPVPLELDASLGGALGVVPIVEGFPLEIMVGGRYAITNDLRLFVGGGAGLIGGLTVPDFRVLTSLSWSPNFADGDRDGIDDGDDGCPGVPEDFDSRADTDGCPEADADHDGILDEADRCFDQREDADGFEDSDGCPDPDDDLDGIADASDKCPRQPGDPEFGGCRPPDQDHDRIADHLDKCPTVSGKGAVDGCDPLIVAATGQGRRQRVVIEEKFQFATDSAELLAASDPLCDRIAKLLLQHSDVAIVVEGHTDDTGFNSYNVKLSIRRATSVRDALVSRGVQSERLDVAGFGAGRPLIDAHTPAARAANRRVELIVVPPPEDKDEAK